MQSVNGAQFLNINSLPLFSAYCVACLVAASPAPSAPVIVMVSVTIMYPSL